MIPLRDLNPARTFPIITYAIIAANVIVFSYQAIVPERTERDLFRLFALKPAFVAGYLKGDATAPYLEEAPTQDFFGQVYLVPVLKEIRLDFWNSLFPFLTSLFLHGGIAHLLGNMWFLHIFGDNVEDRLGHLRFFLFYLAAGILASVAQTLVTPDSSIPTIGASGAISGILGAYMLSFPRARVISVIPLFILFPLIEIPAFLFLFLWFAIQLASGLLSKPGQGGIAFWAHIGGFIVGVAAAVLIPPQRTRLNQRGKVRDVPFEIFNR